MDTVSGTIPVPDPAVGILHGEEEVSQDGYGTPIVIRIDSGHREDDERGGAGGSVEFQLAGAVPFPITDIDGVNDALDRVVRATRRLKAFQNSIYIIGIDEQLEFAVGDLQLFIESVQDLAGLGVTPGRLQDESVTAMS